MTKETPRRPRKAAQYQPSSAEREKAARFIEKLTPSPAAYQKYRALVDMYRQFVGPLIGRQRDNVITGLSLRRSKLFDDREYLIEYVEDAWLNDIAPGCDAACSSMTGQQGQLAEGMLLPPMVFVPASKRRARSNAFGSVVEHEIVHVNQVILGSFPELSTQRRAEDLVDYFLDHAGAEYEACFIQLAHWTDTFPTTAGVSLEHWCLLRGYSQSLEQILSIVVDQDFPAIAVERFLDTLEATLPDLLRCIGADEDLIPWFPPRLISHLLLAARKVIVNVPAAKSSKGIHAADRWLRDRLDGTSSPPQGDFNG